MPTYDASNFAPSAPVAQVTLRDPHREAATEFDTHYKIDTILLREGVILEAIRAPGFDIEALKTAVGDSAEIH